MPRATRAEYPGSIYHVMDRGDRREDSLIIGTAKGAQAVDHTTQTRASRRTMRTTGISIYGPLFAGSVPGPCSASRSRRTRPCGRVNLCQARQGGDPYLSWAALPDQGSLSGHPKTTPPATAITILRAQHLPAGGHTPPSDREVVASRQQGSPVRGKADSFTPEWWPRSRPCRSLPSSTDQRPA